MKKKTNTENIAKRNISTIASNKPALAIDEAVTEIHEKIKELENTLKNTTDDNEKLPQK